MSVFSEEIKEEEIFKKIQLQTSEIPKKSGDILLALLLTADRADCFLLLLGRS